MATSAPDEILSGSAPSAPRGAARGNRTAVPRRAAQRLGLFGELRDPVEELRFLAARRRTGVRRLRAAVGDSSTSSARAARRRDGLVYFLVLLAAWVLGFVDALVHAKDAWASMPDGSHPFGDRCRAGDRGDLARLLHPPGGRGEMKRRTILSHGCALPPSSPRAAAIRNRPHMGLIRNLPEPQRGLLPIDEDREAGEWGDRAPVGAAGLHDHGHRHRSRRSRARPWSCPMATSSSPKAEAAARRSLPRRT